MEFKSFLIKYAEIGVKGKNRFRFEDALIRQMRYALQPVGEFHIRKESGRIFADAKEEYDYDEAVEAFEFLARTEGIICAIESAHAVAYAKKLAPSMGKDEVMIICLSGRGDKDVAAIARYKGVNLYE